MNEIDETEDSERGSPLLSPVGRERGRKRAAQPVSAQKGKVTKRERLAVVMDALTEILKSAGEEEGSKYEYKSQRLALEKEEAEKQRQHHAKEAEKRRQHELELEARRQKAEEDCEKRMYEFISTVLARSNPKE
ncbi:hypothetical protein PF010_g16160 [Phytophthora fragariae]|uniref:Uncharacterized protein n=1 Tax=Phytophthora fragariae TaxID=53985 RepID=A0A6A3J8P6_9STRA|nr:hypothetical protein PF011_g18485 [Phytophthora fragariae]KAE9096906.1 hypothetical protein PF010_g16160 [Phytophthora fragariae]KAE9211864.1 hypothetical protein PF004_g15792 [Phytophthora fragariae]